jgi:hypothetical protein
VSKNSAEYKKAYHRKHRTRILARKKRLAATKRELLAYLQRVRRARNLLEYQERNRRWKKKNPQTPEQKLRGSERQSRRREKQREKEKSRRRALSMSIVNLGDLERPYYVVAGPSARVTEVWPPRDKAQAWLDEHDARSMGSHISSKG